eukprot:scaffold993_cov110-Cylindrotheca_fusiformis.AAC.18
MSSSAPKIDEVSHLLQHFQAKPDFVGSSTSTRLNRSNQRVCIQYRKSLACLELSFLQINASKTHHGIVLQLRFQVSTTKPYTVVCIHAARTDDPTMDEANKRVYQIVKDLCATVSLYSEAKKDEISLFSVVSNLLVALNGKVISEKLNSLRKEISSQQQMIVLPFQKRDDQLCDALELQVFLLRCAATSRFGKTTFVTPVPPSDLWDGGKNDGLTASRILAATNESLHMQRHLFLPRQANPTFSNHQQRQLNRGQLELLAFLSASPWTHGGKVSTVANMKNMATARAFRGAKRIEICFDIGDAIGDDSPRFAQLAETRGVTTAYHGTKVEAIWSILNCGLLNLSGTRLCKNGAMLGNGIYVSPSLKVADFFAQSTTLPPSVFWQWYQQQLLSQKKRYGSCISWLDNLPLDALDKYTISCRAVVQARLILPPSHGGFFADSTSNGSPYFVVPNNQDIRVTALYLTFEFQRQRSFLLIVLAMIVVLWVIGAFI